MAWREARGPTASANSTLGDPCQDPWVRHGPRKATHGKRWSLGSVQSERGLSHRSKRWLCHRLPGNLPADYPSARRQDRDLMRRSRHSGERKRSGGRPHRAARRLISKSAYGFSRKRRRPGPLRGERLDRGVCLILEPLQSIPPCQIGVADPKFSLEPIKPAAMFDPVLDRRKRSRRVYERRHGRCLFLFRTHRNQSRRVVECRRVLPDVLKNLRPLGLFHVNQFLENFCFWTSGNCQTQPVSGPRAALTARGRRNAMSASLHCIQQQASKRDPLDRSYQVGARLLCYIIRVIVAAPDADAGPMPAAKLPRRAVQPQQPVYRGSGPS
jgi:hypothetical protein